MLGISVPPVPLPRTNVVVLGLRANARQFSLLVLVNAFVGAVVGVERSVLPLLASARFGIATASGLFGFIAAFGMAKALANYMAGDLAGNGLWPRSRAVRHSTGRGDPWTRHFCALGARHGCARTA